MTGSLTAMIGGISSLPGQRPVDPVRWNFALAVSWPRFLLPGEAGGTVRKKIRDCSANDDGVVRFNLLDDESCFGSDPQHPSRQRP